jgi:ABC-type nitrate/sulfonate/bicarbonate transport system substrate-binding protein
MLKEQNKRAICFNCEKKDAGAPKLILTAAFPVRYEEQDMKVLYFSREEDALAALKRGMVIRRSLIQQNPDLIKAFQKAFLAGLKIAIEQPDASKRALANYLAINDQEIIEEAYRSFTPLFPKLPYVTEEAIRSVLSVTDHPKAAAANPKDFYDNHFLQELSPGFVKELYSGR